MKKAALAFAALLVLTLVMDPATAGVILTSDPVFGPVIRDTTNNREYLELEPTDAYSYDGVVAELGPGGVFEGWAVASVADMDALVASAGIVHGSTDAGIIAEAEQLRDWFGEVFDSGTAIYCRGLTSDPSTVDPNQQTAFEIGRRTLADPDEAIGSAQGYGGKGLTSEETHLVRDAAIIPEPAGLGLIGLAILGFTKRKR